LIHTLVYGTICFFKTPKQIMFASPRLVRPRWPPPKPVKWLEPAQCDLGFFSWRNFMRSVARPVVAQPSGMKSHCRSNMNHVDVALAQACASLSAPMQCSMRGGCSSCRDLAEPAVLPVPWPATTAAVDRRSVLVLMAAATAIVQSMPQQRPHRPRSHVGTS